MTEALTASGTVHWIGTGLSTGSGLRVLADTAPRLVLWGRTADKARDKLATLGLSGRVDTGTYDPASLAAALAPGDVVVSMLPAGEHPTLLRCCLDHDAHFACCSYLSEAVQAQVPAAEAAGLVVLTEAGLDPGIDHLFADLLVDRGRAVLGDTGATVEFTSYCGGLPAVPNEFRYRFSWAPRGVLTALLSPARYLEDGAEKLVDRPWEATRRQRLGAGTFEVYPNRDSLPYLDRYRLPESWRPRTFVRGTVRLDGWRRAWAEVFDVLGTGDPARVTALADELAARYPATGTDVDRVILAVTLRLIGDDGAGWSGEYLLDVVGDQRESAMSRCVSLPLACGVGDILDGTLPAGLHQAADSAEHAQRWLTVLDKHGVTCRYSDATK